MQYVIPHLHFPFHIHTHTHHTNPPKGQVKVETLYTKRKPSIAIGTMSALTTTLNIEHTSHTHVAYIKG